MTKRIIATLLIAVLMLNIWPVSGVSAVEDPQIVVDNATGIPGGTVDVAIRLVNNPGIASMKLKVSFGEELALNAVAYNSAIGGMSMQPPKMTSPVTLNWFNGIANSEGDWIFATLSFTVAEDAQLGTYPITVTYEADNVYNIAEDNIYFAVVNGGVEAVCGHPNKVATAANAATCEQPGNHLYYTCPDCGKVLKADGVTETLPEAEHIPAKGHTWGAWTQVKAPACDAEGQDQRTCSACGEVQVRDTRISGDPDKILVSNPVDEDFYEGKIIMAIGDSLTNGTGVTAEERYHYLVAQELGMTNINSGTSGAVLCPGGHLPNKFDTLMTAELLTKRNVDVVTIFLGINDWDNGVVNGTYQGKLKYDESLTYYDLGEFGTDDTTTIYGAAKMWCERILELQATEGCEHIQFVFATPVITSYNKSVTNAKDWDQDKVNVFGYTLRQYCTAIMEVCAYYEIPVLDLNMYSGMYYHSEEDNNVDYFGGDGIHPGVNGHRMMADAFVEFLMEGYTYEDRTVVDCGHSFEATVTAPTCTEQGYTTHRCPKCHYSYVDSYVAATGHSSGKPVAENRVEPDCENAGSYEEVVYCTVCNAELSRTEKVLEATGHSYKAVVTAPTCTEQGYTTHTCADCGDSYVDSYVNANGHSYGAWTTTKAATCTAKGTERRDCKNCDHYETRDIAATGHSYKAVVTAPTCTEQGYTTHTCADCGDSYVDSYVDANGHSYGAWTTTKAATCTAKGTERRDCKNCDHYETREIAATGHSYKAVVTAPTCTEQGYTTHTCADCGDSYVDSYVNANGHSYGAWTTTKAATCTAKGTERRDCKNCDHYETRDIAATGHSYKAVVTAPTCTEQGYTTHTCADCGDSYVDSYVDAKGHTPGEPVVENEGPHGSHDLVVYCTECGAELSREYDDGYLPGDINGDGQVNNKDVTRLFQYLSNYDVIVVEEALDVNGDGSINNKDLTRLFQYLSNYDVEIH